MWGNIIEISKAVWSTAYVNTLPDAAFAYIAPGGEKDDEGKTKPRSLRYFPHHGTSVKVASEKDSVDLPHLRNALARLDQADIPDSAKATVKTHLDAHAKQWEIGEYAKACSSEDETKKMWEGVL
jgi:hypothetical protein